MAVEFKIPDVGESVTEVQIGDWRKSEGDSIEQDEILVEIETDKASMELPAPTAGVLEKILRQAGETASVGDVIASIAESDGSPQERREDAEEPESAESKEQKREEVHPADEREEEKRKEEGTEREQSQEAEAKENQERKPQNAEQEPEKPSEDQAEKAEKESQQGRPQRRRVKQVEVKPRVMPDTAPLLSEHGLRADEIEGTGPAGRVLKEDVLRHLRQTDHKKKQQKEEKEEPPAEKKRLPAREDEHVVPMSRLRRTIATRLVEAQQKAALLTTFNEIDMTQVKRLRGAYQENFQSEHEVKLGFMSFFVKATIGALKRVPELNAEIRGEDIVYRDYYDIGVAVSTDRGLVVPVLRNAQFMSFAEIERTINDLAERARQKKIALEELEGGTFTISNGGVYGSLLSTPIVNPPQSGVLGLHAIQDRPVAIEGRVLIRPMMYVALTYDHRIVDGREAVTVLKHIKEMIESPARMLLDI